MTEMMRSAVWWWVIVSSVFIIVIVINSISPNKNRSPFSNYEKLTKVELQKPILWLFYDTDDINSRHWSDFGARTERALNAPFLNLCYESITNQNKHIYRIEVIGGLTGVAELLGGWDKMPSGLHTALVPVREREMNWIRTAILAKYGGLWMCPYAIAIKPFNILSKDTPVFFGSDLGKTYVGKEDSTAIPGFRCIWAPSPGLSLFVEWEQICRNRIDNKTGGQEIRKDENWDWTKLTSKYPTLVNLRGECSRKENGRRIELDDLLVSGSSGNMPFSIASDALYVPLFWQELKLRKSYGWFLRMSENQIMNSDLVVRHLLDVSLN